MKNTVTLAESESQDFQVIDNLLYKYKDELVKIALYKKYILEETASKADLNFFETDTENYIAKAWMYEWYDSLQIAILDEHFRKIGLVKWDKNDDFKNLRIFANLIDSSHIQILINTTTKQKEEKINHINELIRNENMTQDNFAYESDKYISETWYFEEDCKKLNEINNTLKELLKLKKFFDKHQRSEELIAILQQN